MHRLERGFAQCRVPPRLPRRQRGFVLLLALALVLSAAAYLLVAVLPRDTAFRQKSIAETNLALREARAALLSYASGRNGSGKVGYLPCPDTAYLGLPFDPIGSSNTPCGSTGAPSIGRLPWGTLDLVPTDVPLWYAVSGNYKILPPVEPNLGLPGTLVAGGRGDIVAVVLVPGAALPGQDRGADPFAIAAFLEGSNRDASGPFNADGTGNDRFVAITRTELEAILPP